MNSLQTSQEKCYLDWHTITKFTGEVKRLEDGKRVPVAGTMLAALGKFDSQFLARQYLNIVYMHVYGLDLLGGIRHTKGLRKIRGRGRYIYI